MEAAFDTILDEISRYSLNDKEIILDIVQKRLIDEKRDHIYKDYKRAMRNYQEGRVSTGNVDDLFEAVK